MEDFSAEISTFIQFPLFCNFLLYFDSFKDQNVICILYGGNSTIHLQDSFFISG